MELFLETSQMLFANIAALPKNQRGSPDQMALMWILTAFMGHFSEAHSGKAVNFDLSHYSALWDFNPFAVIVDKKIRLLLPVCKKFLEDAEDRSKGEMPLSGKESNLTLAFDDSGNFSKTEDNYLKTLLKDQVFIDKIFREFPELKGASDKIILEKIFPLLNTDLFPASYRYPLQHYFLLRYLITNPDLDKIQKSKEVVPGSIQFKKAGEHKRSFNISIEFSGSQNYFSDTREWEDYRSSSTVFKEYQLPIQHPGFNQLLHSGLFLCEGAVYEQFIERTLNNWTSNSFSAVTLKAAPGLSRHETQALAFMFSKKAVFLSALLSHLNTNHENLLGRDFQLLVYHALFTGNTLADSLACFPEVGDKLAEKLMSLVDLHQKLGNPQVQFFLLNLLDQISLHTSLPLNAVHQKRTPC